MTQQQKQQQKNPARLYNQLQEMLMQAPEETMKFLEAMMKALELKMQVPRICNTIIHDLQGIICRKERKPNNRMSLSEFRNHIQNS